MTANLEVAAALRALPATLREARRVSGMSAHVAARIIGVSRATVWRVEAGYPFTDRTAIAILCALDHPALRRTNETGSANSKGAS